MTASMSDICSPETTQDTVGDKWQPQGYVKLAHLFGKYPEAAIFRRFGPLSMIALLNLQAKLIALEDELKDAFFAADTSDVEDVKEFSKNFTKLHQSRTACDVAIPADGTRAVAAGTSTRQLAVVEEIEKTVKEYYELLLRCSQAAQLSQPENPQVRFLQRWLEGTKEGNNFLPRNLEALTWDPTYRDDFVTLIQSTSWINPKLQDIWFFMKSLPSPTALDALRKISSSFQRSKHPSEPKDDVELGRTQDFDASARGKFSRRVWRAIVTLLASLMPVLVILWLYHVDQTLHRIVIAICTTAFVGAFMFLFTSASTKEVFGATAAFAAIVVVFIGTANNTNGP